MSLSVAIGIYFKRLTAASACRLYRFKHIVAYSSFKAHSKQRAISTLVCFFFDNGRCMFCPGLGTRQAQSYVRREGEMNKRKLGSFVLCAMLLAVCTSAEAQQPKKVQVIGYLSPTDAA